MSLAMSNNVSIIKGQLTYTIRLLEQCLNAITIIALKDRYQYFESEIQLYISCCKLFRNTLYNENLSSDELSELLNNVKILESQLQAAQHEECIVKSCIDQCLSSLYKVQQLLEVI